MLEPGSYYHIYNQANGSENLFREQRNYPYFLSKLLQHIHPVAHVYAWCLLPNHFHAMIKVRSSKEICRNMELGDIDENAIQLLISQQFSNLFNGYAKAINKAYKRRGSLFQRPFKNRKVDDVNYMLRLLLYIHNNPVKHRFVNDARKWQHSSIHVYLDLDNCDEALKPDFETAVEWFGDMMQFMTAHFGDE